MRALFSYYRRQNLAAFGWTALALFVTAWLLAAPLAPLKDGILKLIAESPLLQKFGAGLMGIDLQGELTIRLLAGSTWSHPFLFALLWGFAVTRSTHFPVEVGESNSIDFLYALPFTRHQILLVQSLVAAAALLLLQGVTLGGFLLGSLPLGEDSLTTVELIPVAINLFCTSLTFLAIGTLVGILFRTRAAAHGVAGVFALWSLLLGYLKPVLPAVKSVSATGLLHYFKPGEILQSGRFPWQDCVVLTLLAVVFWVCAHLAIARRDLC